MDAVISQARRLVALAQEAAAAQAAVEEAEAAEAAHAYAGSGRGEARGACGWCPARGMALPAGHPLCPCGTPRGSDCTEVGHAGAGAKGKRAGETRHTRAQLAEAQAMAARTAELRAVAEAARGALYAVAGQAAGIAGLRAVAAGDARQAVGILALLLGLPAVAETEERAAVEAPGALPSRRSRKAAAPAPSVAAVAGAQGVRWAQVQARVALPVLQAVAADVAAGALALRLLWAETLAEGFERERLTAAEAVAQRSMVPAGLLRVA